MTSRAERGTCTFKDWAAALEEEISGKDLACALAAVALRTGERFGSHLWFVEIFGRRWSYLAGEVRDQPADSRLIRENLDHDIGLVIENWGAMGREDRDHFRDLVNRMIAARAAEKEGPAWTVSALKAT